MSFVSHETIQENKIYEIHLIVTFLQNATKKPNLTNDLEEKLIAKFLIFDNNVCIGEFLWSKILKIQCH